MKKFIATSILIISIISKSYTQQTTKVYTPNNSPVTAILFSEMSAADIANINALAAAQFPNAQRIDDASSKYNCHSYAWHMSPNAGSKVWINTPGDDTYWLDKSYMEVCNELIGTKVSYYTGDHSANNIGSGFYISKWGQYPLMKHTPNNTPPSYQPNQRKYYIRTPQIVGPDSFCDNTTYQLDNLPAGLTVTWAATGAIQISGSTTTNPVMVNKAFDGSGTLTANIISPCGNQTISKVIKVGEPAYQNISVLWKDWMDGSSIIFSVPKTQGVTYQWIIDGFPIPNATGSSYMHPANSCYSPDPIQIYWSAKVLITNNCGTTTICQDFKLNCNTYPKINPLGSCGFVAPPEYEIIAEEQEFIISPNPSNNLLNVSQKIGAATDSEPINFAPSKKPFSIKLYDANGSILKEGESKTGDDLSLDVSSIPNGTYFLHIGQGKELIKKQVIINHQ